ncbi:hypothetical protein [Microbacterium sp. CIAB417]|uniref:hypothetical protein n=1 Tax=Microbacterium sp. CIAB417 TaxID=2860287 RepID=UPI001FAD5C3E|nr:hypothetical protein [Microbacterium sp. CIAB417]
MDLNNYWAAYHSTLKKIADEKPQTFDSLKGLLDAFHEPSAGDAFFPGGADETLGDALYEAGWRIDWREGDYLWVATSRTGETITYIEGDVYRGNKLDS